MKKIVERTDFLCARGMRQALFISIYLFTSTSFAINDDEASVLRELSIYEHIELLNAIEQSNIDTHTIYNLITSFSPSCHYVTAQNLLADTEQTPLQPGEHVAKKARKEDLPEKNEPLRHYNILKRKKIGKRIKNYRSNHRLITVRRFYPELIALIEALITNTSCSPLSKFLSHQYISGDEDTKRLTGNLKKSFDRIFARHESKKQLKSSEANSLATATDTPKLADHQVNTSLHSPSAHSSDEPLDSHNKKIPVITPLKKARDVHIAVELLKKRCNELFPGKFNFEIDDSNMLLVHVSFVAPFGWWQGAAYVLEFNFSNLESDGPELKIIASPPVSHKYGQSLCLVQLSPHSACEFFWEGKFVKRYDSRNFSPAEQMLNAIHALIYDLDILDSWEGGILGNTSSFYSEIHGLALRKSNLSMAIDTLSDEIAKNNQAVNKLGFSNVLSFETNKKRILKDLEKNLQVRSNRNLPYITPDEIIDTRYIGLPDQFYGKKDNYDDENTAIFIPVEMRKQAEVIEFYAHDVNTEVDLIRIALNNSREFMFDREIISSCFTIFAGKEKIASNQIKEHLNALIEDNKKHYKHINQQKNSNKLNRLAMILQKKADSDVDSDEIFSHDSHVCSKSDTFEIHLRANKAQANRGNMVKQYDLTVPSETQKKTERYFGGNQFGSNANVWIGDFNSDMTSVQKMLSKEALWDLSRKLFRLHNDAKSWTTYNGNNIIFKSLLMLIANTIDKEGNTTWKPTQSFLELILSRVELAGDIAQDESRIEEKNFSLLKLATKGFIPKTNLQDFAHLLNAISPALNHLQFTQNITKQRIKNRIFLNMVMEFLVRSMVYELVKKDSDLASAIKSNIELIDLKYMENINKKGLTITTHLLILFDFMTNRVAGKPIEEKEIHELQKTVRKFQSVLTNQPMHVDSTPRIIRVLEKLLADENDTGEFLDIHSETTQNMITCSVLEEVRRRVNDTSLKEPLQRYLDSQQYDVDFFDKAETLSLIEQIESLIPENYINEPVAGGYRQTCHFCRKHYTTRNIIAGRRNSNDKNKPPEKKRPRKITPRHTECARANARNKKECARMYRETEERRPKKLSSSAYTTTFNPVPEGYSLERIPGDGNCMYTAIARAMTRMSGMEINQQEIRNIIQQNLETIFTVIQDQSDHFYQSALMRQLGLLINFDADVIHTMIEDRVIAQSADSRSMQTFEQQFGNIALVSLLSITHDIPFQVITEYNSDRSASTYGIAQWIEHAPMLLDVIVNSGRFNLNHLDENLITAVRTGNREMMVTFAQSATNVEPDSYLLHYPATGRLHAHFDLVVRDRPEPEEFGSEMMETNNPAESPEAANPLWLPPLIAVSLFVRKSKQ